MLEVRDSPSQDPKSGRLGYAEEVTFPPGSEPLLLLAEAETGAWAWP